MARPFRFQPPALADGTLVRARLLDRLARRWDRRLVSVVAGPGFGKTVLLVTAMSDGSRRGAGRDVWLSCEPSDVDGEGLVAGLAMSFGLERGVDLDDVFAAVWVQAPEPVCVLLDDVHEIAAGSPGAAVLARLVAELPRNGHVVLASREPVPIQTARLAVSGQLERVGEAELMFDQSELESFASSHGVDARMLSSSGGWPALAALAATARADLVFEYLWDEVLAGVGDRRAHGLARFAIAGGGDDDVARAVVPWARGVNDLVADLPLVERSRHEWVALHPLWSPSLRRLLTDADADDARRRAAAVHRGAGRFSLAVDLLSESEAWEDVLAVIREAEIEPGTRMDGTAFGTWYRTLPVEHRVRPAARFAAGIELQARAPLEALTLFEEAASGFRACGDVDGEVAVLHQDGQVRWWANDLDGLLRLYQRVVTLAAAGSAAASMVAAVGTAAIAHLGGDSDGTLQALAAIDDRLVGGWSPTIHWLRHVAYRRDGDLLRAELELDAVVGPAPADIGPQLKLARLRMDWLAGRVDHVRAQLPDIEQHYRTATNRYLHTETVLELAGKMAFLGDLNAARDLVDGVEPLMSETPGALAHVLRLIALAGIAVGDGDEVAATALLAADPLTTPGRPDGWYWRDRAALGLLHGLLPQHRRHWDAEPLAPTHHVGLHLVRALEAARDGDLTTVRTMHWPEPGVVRAHLPMRWVAELVAAGRATGNPAPEALSAALGAHLRPALRALAAAATSAPAIAAAAGRMVAEMPVVPAYRLRISVLGPLELRRDDVVIDHPDLHRQRVRELLCYLVAHPRTRRDAAADALWPELADPRHNFRVTLNYLQRILQPERLRSDPPFFVQAQGEWLTLVRDDQLQVDAWHLDAHLDAGDVAEQARDPGAALDAYRAALPLWRGEPFADVADGLWAQLEQTRWRTRYTTAAIRLGELALANGAPSEARHAAEHALTADPTSETGYQLLARSHLAVDDTVGARRALEACQRALAELNVQTDSTTRKLLTIINGPNST